MERSKHRAFEYDEIFKLHRSVKCWAHSRESRRRNIFLFDYNSVLHRGAVIKGYRNEFSGIVHSPALLPTGRPTHDTMAYANFSLRESTWFLVLSTPPCMRDQPVILKFNRRDVVALASVGTCELYRPTKSRHRRRSRRPRCRGAKDISFASNFICPLFPSSAHTYVIVSCYSIIHSRVR